jgi:hypothetical protein
MKRAEKISQLDGNTLALAMKEGPDTAEYYQKLDICIYTTQAWGILQKCWKGYKIAKGQDGLKKMRYYAEGISISLLPCRSLHYFSLLP